MLKVKTQMNNVQKLFDNNSEEYYHELYKKVQDTYLADSRPWVIGYSGGKDSTATLQLVWQSLRKLPKEKLTKKVFIISSDTFVESPIIVNYIDHNHNLINLNAKKQNLPFEAYKVTPKIDNTFWVNMIGRGYPAPYSRFRWCTDRLKIEPANRFITEMVTSYGEVIVVLGARFSESSTRAGSMKKRKEVGNDLTRHSTLTNAWVFTPIENWYTEEVWEYLLSIPSPWESDNEELLKMYKDAQDGECPLIIDKTSPSCGNSRFGCWTCTVVNKDTSMESIIKNGEEWLRPLLDLRDWLASTSDPEKKKDIRSVRRRNGKIQYFDNNGDKKLIWGPFTLDFRKKILSKLLKAQKAVQNNGTSNIILISDEELLKIRQLWLFEEGDWEDSLPVIYKKITGKELAVSKEDWAGMGSLELDLLQNICEENNVPLGLLTELFDAERKQHGMSRRSAIYNDIKNILKKDWRNRQDVLKELGIEL